jgi:hypothetical protein
MAEIVPISFIEVPVKKSTANETGRVNSGCPVRIK